MSAQGLSNSLIILIIVMSFTPLATAASTTTKDTGTDSTSQATTSPTTTTTSKATTTSTQPSTSPLTSTTTTLAPANLGDNCSSVTDGGNWCDTSIAGTAVCEGGLCACGSGFFRKDISTCLAEAVLTPENLTFPVITSTSLQVGWQMAESLMWKFNVTCTGTSVSKTEQELEIMVANFIGLTPGDEYSVTVTAYFTNDVNIEYSAAKPATQSIDPAKPGNVIQSIYRAPEIELQWSPSDGFVDKYTVVYNGTPYDTPNNDTKITLYSLTAGTTYDVTITAIRHNRKSQERRDTFTTEVEPPSPPINLGFDYLTHNSVLLQWTQPTHPNGNLRGYIVCYDEKVYKDMIDLTRSLCLDAGNMQSYQVEELKPGAFYNFTVYSTNTEFNSTTPAELRNTVQTKEAVPGKVTDLNIEAKNLSLVVTWKRPEEPNGNIIQYQIDWSSVNINCTDCLNTSHSQTCPPAGSTNCSKDSDTSIAVNEKDMKYTISSLEPFTNYSVTVTPYTSAGPGAGDSTTTKTSVIKPGPVKNVTVTVRNSTAITVHWVEPDKDPGPVNYTVRAEDMIFGQQISQGCAVEGIDTTSCTVSGLEEYWVYQFVVIASTTAGDSDERRSGNYTTQEGIPGPVQDIRHSLLNSSWNCNATKVVIEWSEPVLMNRNSLIRVYRIKDSGENSVDLDHIVSHPEPYRQSARRFSDTLSGLKAEKGYVKTIQAMTEGSQFGVEMPFEFTTGSCAPPDWPSNTNISEKSGKRTTSSFTVTMQTSFFLNDEQGMVRERGLIVSKTDKALTLQELLSAKARTWSTSKRNSFKDPYAITVEAPDSAESRIEIIVGENAECESQTNLNAVCNGQLPPSQKFYVLAYACTSPNKCSHSNFFGAYATAALPAPQSSSNAPVIAGVVVAVCLVIIIVALVILQLRGVIDIPKLWRKSGEMKGPTEIDAPIQTKRPMRLSQFDDYLVELHKDTNLLFSSQYEDIGKLSKQIYEEQTTEAANLEDNKAKNRWVNILPFDHSRVKLQQLDDDDPTSDYINANFIPGFKHKREYIATQGPLPGTIDDFWRMVWEHNVSIIVMLTQCKEGNRGMGGEMMVKCENYWPNEVHEAKQYGDVVVNPVSVSTLNKYNITIFEVSVNNVKRTVHHFHYIEFPDMSAIVEYDIFLEFMQTVRGHYPRTMESPIVVHCSAGVGRTGTFIALDMLSQQLNRPDFNWDMKVDIFDMVIGMRNHRTNMIQTESQYVMIHDCLSAMLEMKKRATEEQNENLYVNQSYDPYPEVLYENLKGNEMKTDL